MRPDPAPAVVTFHVWKVTRPGWALRRVATDRFTVRRFPGLRFARVLGTASGTTYAPRDADPSRWAILATWADQYAAAAYEQSELIGRWQDSAIESWTARLHPRASRGRWSGREPFGQPAGDHAAEGPVAALTRARLHPLRSKRFRRAVGPVAQQLSGQDGLIFGLGIGEWPVGLQGTFSLWSTTGALRDFAYGGGAHHEVVRRTPSERWFSEELFARFSVLRASGSVDGIEMSR